MSPSRMRAALFHRFGGPEVIEIEEVDVPNPGAGELLVQVRATGMNHLDLGVRRGPAIEMPMPHIGGADVAGVVVARGPGHGQIEEVEVGTRVVVNPALYCGRCRQCARGEESLCDTFRILGARTPGGFAEYVAVPAGNVYPIPEQIPDTAAAALPISYQTAWRAILNRAAVRPGEDVLVLGASGGTAIASIQIAKLAGARVFAVTSGADRVERARVVGADHAYDRLEVDFAERVREDTGGRGVDVVVENVGEATWDGSVRALAPAGRLVTYGASTGTRASIDIRRLYWRQLQLIGTTMANRGEFEAMLRAVWAGRIQPVIDSVVPLAEAGRAHARLEEGRQFGKIVLVP